MDIKQIIHAIVTALFAAALAGAYWLGGNHVQAKWEAADAKAKASAVQSARKIEHKVAASDAAASENYQKGLEDGKTELQGALDRLRAALRLREQQLAGARAVPATADSAGRRDASAPADFPSAHGDDALRLAAEADDVVRQLTACQALVTADRTATQ